MSSINIDERTVSKHTIKKGKKKYVQYRITLPREFAEEHNVSKMYLIADSIGMLVPNKETLLKIMSEFPSIRELVLHGEEYKDINQLFEYWDKMTHDQQNKILGVMAVELQPKGENENEL